MNNLTLNGLKKLPLGFRFQPTDEELVFQYLKCKVFSYPLPTSIIPDLNVCNFDPWDLPGEMEDEKYFFSTKEAKYRTGNRINRATASGYWKATGPDKQIISRRNEEGGMRKSLVFHMGKPPHGSRTDWIMHEYRLFTLSNNQNYLNHEMEKWVLCHVFLKKTGKKSSDEEEIMQTFCNNSNEKVKKPKALIHKMKPKLFDFMREKDGITAESSSSSSSWSSNITEVSSSAGSMQY
ncbi:putative PLC-like phosphodiesterases superfamily protein [Hibiscus syriacus]|uniref:PLC-like phosphodiesterases superfamily protein n=1 Tax=Hibiscus syriacus TaxID=106335 RepID=A0A6A2XV88_HIBSY|nr:NAC domain-containing protein 83-like [Hibiscus syriacus]KAE8665926.1 putative PLC-like phosphodiesterases superfamily protein [Hibiscus syriacus]